MELDRFPYLLQNKLAVAPGVGRSEVLHASGDLNVIGILDSSALQELAKTQVEAVVEAGKHSSVGCVPLSLSLEVKDFLQNIPPELIRCLCSLFTRSWS